MKKTYVIIGSLLVCLGIFLKTMTSVWADTSAFELYKLEDNGNRTLISAYMTFEEANQAMKYNETTFPCSNGYAIIKDGAVKNITYGLVNFRTKASSSLNTNYQIEGDSRKGYTNGYYGADGAFLGTNEDGSLVRFKQAGVIGWVNASEVEIVDIVTYYDKVYTNSYNAYYSNASNPVELKHNIVTNIYSSAMSIITLSHDIPSGMQTSTSKNKTFYLSYDGNYFYEESLTGYKLMIDDYKAGTYEHAINKDNPYYNYYQYLSHRSVSNYTAANIQQYFSNYTSKPTGDTLLPNESLLYGEEVSFIQYQNEYGANALLMLAEAINESAWGRSNIAINANNLFGHNAVDASPGASATRYYSAAQSIRSQAKKYVSEGYLDPCDGRSVGENGASSLCHLGRYFGSNSGDKASGMNVKYASDPYWGEKAAQNYYYFDKNYGFQDFGKYTIGIKASKNSYPVKASPNSAAITLYETGPAMNYPYLILETVTGENINGSTTWYKIQTDPTLNASRTGIVQDQGEYDFRNNYGYIHSSALNFIRPGKKLKPMYQITFDPNGGKFEDNFGTSKVLYVEEYVIPVVSTPSKEGYTFIGWNETVVGATEDVVYRAVYQSLNPETKTYTITFESNGGLFSDGSTSKTVVVDEGIIPTIEEPSKEGYTFTGWNPTVVAAQSNATYQATYQKKEPSVVEPTETDGEFYLNELTWNATQKVYQMSGYLILLQVDNSASAQYELILKNKNNQKEYRFPMSAWTSNVPYDLGQENGNSYVNSWFQGTFDMREVEVGDYDLYMEATKGNYHTRQMVNNLFNRPIDRRAKIDQVGYNFKVQLSLKSKKIELNVREAQNMMTTNTAPTFRNMVNDYDNMKFIDNQLNIIGTSYNYGGTYAEPSSITRKLILENINTFEQFTYELGSTQNGSYPIISSDNKSKTYGWYHSNVNIADLPKGTYSMLIYTKTVDSEDYGEIVDIFGAINQAETTINGKKYQISLNRSRQNRIELIVE